MGYEIVVVGIVASIIGGVIVNWVKGKQEEASDQLRALVASVDRLVVELTEIKSDLRSLSEMAEARFENLEEHNRDQEGRLRDVERKIRD